MNLVSINRYRKMPNYLLRYSFWIVLCAHILLLLGLSTVWLPTVSKEKTPSLAIPAYVYKKTVPQQAQPQQVPQPVPKQPTLDPPPKAVSELKVNHPIAPSKIAKSNPLIKEIKGLQVMNISQKTEPVHLIGDKTVPAPLLVILGKALTRHLVYPKIAVDFNIRGTALIGILLHPDGTVTDAQLVRTSGAGVLDNAALTAAYEISPLQNINTYLTEPRYIVVGIIFG